MNHRIKKKKSQLKRIPSVHNPEEHNIFLQLRSPKFSRGQKLKILMVLFFYVFMYLIFWELEYRIVQSVDFPCQSALYQETLICEFCHECNADRALYEHQGCSECNTLILHSAQHTRENWDWRYLGFIIAHMTKMWTLCSIVSSWNERKNFNFWFGLFT